MSFKFMSFEFSYSSNDWFVEGNECYDFEDFLDYIEKITGKEKADEVCKLFYKWYSMIEEAPKSDEIRITIQNEMNELDRELMKY